MITTAQLQRNLSEAHALFLQIHGELLTQQATLQRRLGELRAVKEAVEIQGAAPPKVQPEIVPFLVTVDAMPQIDDMILDMESLLGALEDITGGEADSEAAEPPAASGPN